MAPGSKSCFQLAGRRGVFLPMVCVLLLLIMASALILSRFGTGTRNALRRHEWVQKCSIAASSSIIEARRSVQAMLGTTVGLWPRADIASRVWAQGDKDFFRNLLPPANGPVPPGIEITPGVSVTAFNPTIIVSNVRIRCLSRTVSNGLAQGLLSFSARVETDDTATGLGAAGIHVAISREELIRYVVSRDPDRGLLLLLLPGQAAVREAAL